MPHVRLSADFGDHQRGQIVWLTADELSDADAARAVGKVYPRPVPGVPVPASSNDVREDAPAAPGAEQDDAPRRPRPESYGRPKTPPASADGVPQHDASRE